MGVVGRWRIGKRIVCLGWCRAVALIWVEVGCGVCGEAGCVRGFGMGGKAGIAGRLG